MRFRVGQKVRLLHESGNGVVTALIDDSHVEVDLGDDFPIDMHISEIVPVDQSEEAFSTVEKDKSPQSTPSKSFGSAIPDLSLVVTREEDGSREFILVNPEPVTILYTCYTRSGKKFNGMDSGRVDDHGGVAVMFKTIASKPLNINSFYFQFIVFAPGNGYPHTPETFELPWPKNVLQKPSQLIPALNRDGWVFSLRKEQLEKDVQAIAESEFVRIIRQEAPQKRVEGEVDLHIEALTKNPFELAPSEMLAFQLKHLEEKLSQALAENYASLVIIHGIGEGKLRKAVTDRLKKLPHIKEFSPADPKKYGNGATRVIFK